MDGEDRGDVKGWEVKPSRVEMPRRRRRPAAQPGFRNQHACPHPRLDGWETAGQHYELLGVAG